MTSQEQLVDIPKVRGKCADYEYTEWAMWDDETAYKMTAENGTVVGIIVYEGSEINAFIGNNGFWGIGAGDHFVGMNIKNGSYTYIKGGYEVITTNPYAYAPSFTLQENEVLVVWHV